MRGSGGSDGRETDSDSALRERHGLEGRLAQMEQKLIGERTRAATGRSPDRAVAGSDLPPRDPEGV